MTETPDPNAPLATPPDDAFAAALRGYAAFDVTAVAIIDVDLETTAARWFFG